MFWFSDADWAGDVNDRKPTSGFLSVLNGGPLTWKSKKQSCVALSTSEAEYIALSGAAQECIWLSVRSPPGPATLHEDCNDQESSVSRKSQTCGH